MHKHKKEYYRSGKIKEELYFIDEKSLLHRLDGPAYIYYYENGVILEKSYFINGENHRDNGGPAQINHFESGELQYEAYLIKGMRHRLDGPAEIMYYKSREIRYEHYYIDDLLLFEFENYRNNTGKLFRYIEKYPNYIKQIERLARHNNWLTEEQLLILSGLSFFR
jgi:antitoxin component YwqK of YwqJK toxin-antitoxin module